MPLYLFSVRVHYMPNEVSMFQFIQINLSVNQCLHIPVSFPLKRHCENLSEHNINGHFSVQV